MDAVFAVLVVVLLMVLVMLFACLCRISDLKKELRLSHENYRDLEKSKVTILNDFSQKMAAWQEEKHMVAALLDVVHQIEDRIRK